MYPIKILNDEIRKYLNNKSDKQVRDEDNKPKIYYKLPYFRTNFKTNSKKAKEIMQRIMQRNRHHTLFFSLQKRIPFTIKK